MRKLGLLALTLVLCSTLGCAPIERQAYRTFVGAKAFLDSVKKVHPECASGAVSQVCSVLAKATAAKDSIIDAAEVYCASPSFDATKDPGECSPPAKGTPANDQAVAKLKAAISMYNQMSADLKGVL